jgi:hypothetical protein
MDNLHNGLLQLNCLYNIGLTKLYNLPNTLIDIIFTSKYHTDDCIKINANCSYYKLHPYQDSEIMFMPIHILLNNLLNDTIYIIAGIGQRTSINLINRLQQDFDKSLFKYDMLDHKIFDDV